MWLMSTELAYYDDVYKQSLEAEVLRVDSSDDRHVVFLDRSIFYPHGGGQPADHGSIEGSEGRLQISDVQYRNLVIHHMGRLDGNLEPEEKVMCQIDWNRRFWNMRVHTAGHLIHDVLMDLTDVLTPTKAEHGSKPFVEYRGELEGITAPQLEERVNELVREDRAVHTGNIALEDLRREAKFVPPNLPKDKPLRFLQIEGFYMMPDGGTHVQKTREIGRVQITAITIKRGRTFVRYRVHD